jgi:hypothetical protein
MRKTSSVRLHKLAARNRGTPASGFLKSAQSAAVVQQASEKRFLGARRKEQRRQAQLGSLPKLTCKTFRNRYLSFFQHRLPKEGHPTASIALRLKKRPTDQGTRGSPDCLAGKSACWRAPVGPRCADSKPSDAAADCNLSLWLPRSRGRLFPKQ